MERFGLVGLPNAGKTSLFNALTGAEAYAAPFAFATTDPNIGVAKVPDKRVDQLTELSQSQKTAHATVQFTDIGGLIEGASKGEGLGNAFLADIREVDAIVYVLRAFELPNDPEANDPPVEQLRLLELELALADYDSATRQHEKLARAGKGDPEEKDAADLLAKAIEPLGQGTPIYRTNLTDDERQAMRRFFLLTNKPVLAVVNIAEDSIGTEAEVTAPVQQELNGAQVIALCVQLESEAGQLDPAERQEMLEALGLGDGALATFLASSYHLLGLRTFLTTGEKESRAWTFRAGSTAAECAGVIHSDMQRGFIRADTVSYDDLISAGSWNAAKDKGLLRSEGRNYLTQDGDVMLFKFNI